MTLHVINVKSQQQQQQQQQQQNWYIKLSHKLANYYNLIVR